VGQGNDACGIGCGIVKASDAYKQATGRSAKTEGHLEMYYRFACNEYLAISPDLQVITNPFGKDAPNGDSTIVVVGIRAQIDF
jgi:Carbohydrate-selective porin, OprB family.